MKSKLKRGLIGFVGLMLSPITWFNDPIVNIPIAYIFAWPFHYISGSLFYVMVMIGYWLTNIIGSIMLRRVLSIATSKAVNKRREIIKDILFSTLITLVLILLMLMGVIEPIEF